MTTTLDRLKVSILLTLLAGYFVLGYAFMLLRIPPTGFGIPLGELLLVFVLIGIDPRRILSRMNAAVMLAPFLLWWVWGLGHLAFNTAERGYWALRDATQLIESLFVIVGFSLAADPSTLQRLARWLRPILIVACLYGLLFVVGDQIIAISPTIPDASGYPVPIFGDFAMSDTMLLWGAFACLTAPADRPAVRLLRTLLAGFLIAYAVAVLQMRTTYLQLMAMSALLLLVRPRALGRLGIAIPLLLFLLLLVDAFNLRIAGRLTSNISLSFFWDHILAIFGIGATGQGAIAGAASGVPLRLHWWTRIYEQLTADPVTLLTGLGYGVPLTDFHDTSGGIVREPHNSFISVVARVGVVGFFAWAWMQAELFRVGFLAYRESRRRGLYLAARLCLLIVAFAILTLVGCVGEDNMEKPYFAIPYYTFWGIVLRIAYRLRVETRAGAHMRYAAGPAVAMPHPRAP
jgi:hypothetical protein